MQRAGLTGAVGAGGRAARQPRGPLSHHPDSPIQAPEPCTHLARLWRRDLLSSRYVSPGRPAIPRASSISCPPPPRSCIAISRAVAHPRPRPAATWLLRNVPCVGRRSSHRPSTLRLTLPSDETDETDRIESPPGLPGQARPPGIAPRPARRPEPSPSPLPRRKPRAGWLPVARPNHDLEAPNGRPAATTPTRAQLDAGGPAARPSPALPVAAVSLHVHVAHTQGRPPRFGRRAPRCCPRSPSCLHSEARRLEAAA